MNRRQQVRFQELPRLAPKADTLPHPSQGSRRRRARAGQVTTTRTNTDHQGRSTRIFADQ